MNMKRFFFFRIPGSLPRHFVFATMKLSMSLLSRWYLFCRLLGMTKKNLSKLSLFLSPIPHHRIIITMTIKRKRAQCISNKKWKYSWIQKHDLLKHSNHYGSDGMDGTRVIRFFLHPFPLQSLRTRKNGKRTIDKKISHTKGFRRHFPLFVKMITSSSCFKMNIKCTR